MMISPGQNDRVLRIVSELRSKDAKLSLPDAVRAAQEAVRKEHEQAVSLARHARRVSGRTMSDTQVDLMCRGDMSRIAHDLRVQEIERQHRGQAGGRK
jgi:translation initiation factor 2B subunit (eIF-2B alpha/beta/delta family)